MNTLIILGNRLNDDNSGTQTMNKRLNIALSLIATTTIDKIILSGGMANTTATISEAQYMSNYLVDAGIDENIIIKEEQSLTTEQNALFCAPLVSEQEAIYLVTTPEHMLRPFLNPRKLFKKAMPNNKIIPISKEN